MPISFNVSLQEVVDESIDVLCILKFVRDKPVTLQTTTGRCPTIWGEDEAQDSYLVSELEGSNRPQARGNCSQRRVGDARLLTVSQIGEQIRAGTQR
jgi:hypothetical protein